MLLYCKPLSRRLVLTIVIFRTSSRVLLGAFLSTFLAAPRTVAHPCVLILIMMVTRSVANPGNLQDGGNDQPRKLMKPRSHDREPHSYVDDTYVLTSILAMRAHAVSSVLRCHLIVCFFVPRTGRSAHTFDQLQPVPTLSRLPVPLMATQLSPLRLRTTIRMEHLVTHRTVHLTLLRTSRTLHAHRCGGEIRTTRSSSPTTRGMRSTRTCTRRPTTPGPVARRCLGATRPTAVG
jgi:hypothetical protein